MSRTLKFIAGCLPFLGVGQQLRASREALKATLPANSRLVKMRASRDNLSNLGRIEEADKVRYGQRPPSSVYDLTKQNALHRYPVD